jgi:type I pantothenate kinase
MAIDKAATAAPYQKFTREEWRSRCGEWPMPLAEGDLEKLQGQIETVSLEEIRDIYVPIARLLHVYQATETERAKRIQKFLGREVKKIPFIIGVSGSVAVGKSMTSRVLKALLTEGPDNLNVVIIPTDGFLKTTAQLKAENLMERKGFPESYCIQDILNFLQAIKSGDLMVKAPIYSHKTYDIKPDVFREVSGTDVIILEGLNILQTGLPSSVKQPKCFVSDYLDFSIYVDADTTDIEEWFLHRFMTFRQLAKNKPGDFFYQFARMMDEAAHYFASNVWRDINLANLEQNILPFKDRADLILHKGKDHHVDQVLLRNH